jgi:two-component system chemotaxis sensor kinase CheA
MSEMDEIIKEFLVESHENLDQLDQDLVALEKDPSGQPILASIFRTIHTIKGTCGFLGFGKLESVAHVGENLLSKLRDGAIIVDRPIISVLLALTDAVRQMLNSIEKIGAEGDEDYTELIDLLAKFALGHLGVTSPAVSAAAVVAVALENTITAAECDPSGDQEPERIGDILLKSGAVTEEDVTQASRAQIEGDPRRLGEILIEKGAAKPQEVRDALQQQSESHSTVSEANVRVDVGLLDKLMNLVGELVLARNQILQYTATQENVAFQATSQRLNLITTELQEGVMKTRMQPIGTIWSKFPRVVRDLSLSCGKQVRLEMEGKETELDRTIIEAIKDPLTHVVRNSVDHGIEASEKRAAAGKPAEGTLLLRAFHEGGQVIIEIVDDGAGIHTERVKQKALERSLVTPDQAARMSERELQNLIFLPGFSTAEKISNVSGRGVGMDVVKTNIEKIGGAVDIQSQFGQGTTLRIKIPLTLAIIPALIVASESDRFAIPQVNLVELVRLEGEQALKGIESIHGAPVYRLRGRLLPLIYLNQTLGLARGSAEEQAAINIVVVSADDRQFGLVVDDIHDTEEIVVKPLSKQLKSVAVFAGATIMGDGKVALILDVMGLAMQGHAAGESRGRALKHTEPEAAQAEDKQTLLLFRLGAARRMAIPLSAVARLEEFTTSMIERVGDQEVVQYRGQIMPLLRLSRILRAESAATEPSDVPFQVIVYTQDQRSVGLVVDQILDIVHQTLQIQTQGRAKGLTGSAVVEERVTELLDIQSIIREADPTFFATAEAV